MLLLMTSGADPLASGKVGQLVEAMAAFQRERSGRLPQLRGAIPEKPARFGVLAVSSLDDPGLLVGLLQSIVGPEGARRQEPPLEWEACETVGVGAVLVKKSPTRGGEATEISYLKTGGQGDHDRVVGHIFGETGQETFKWVITEAETWLRGILVKKQRRTGRTGGWRELFEKEMLWDRTLLCADCLHGYFAPPAGAVCTGQTFKLRAYKEACWERLRQIEHTSCFIGKSFSYATTLILWGGRVYLRYSKNMETRDRSAWLVARVLKEGAGRKIAEEEEVNRIHGEPASSLCSSCGCYWGDHPCYARRVDATSNEGSTLLPGWLARMVKPAGGEGEEAPSPRLEKHVYCMFCQQSLSREEKVLVRRDPEREARFGGKLARYSHHDSQGTFHLESSPGDPCALFRGREACEFLLTLADSSNNAHRDLKELQNLRDPCWMLETPPPRKWGVTLLCHFTVFTA